MQARMLTHLHREMLAYVLLCICASDHHVHWNNDNCRASGKPAWHDLCNRTVSAKSPWCCPADSDCAMGGRYAGRGYEREEDVGKGGTLLVKGLKSMWRQAAPIVRNTLQGALRRIIMQVCTCPASDPCPLLLHQAERGCRSPAAAPTYARLLLCAAASSCVGLL